MTKVLINPCFEEEVPSTKRLGVVVPFTGTFQEPKNRTPEFLVQPDREHEPDTDPTKAFYAGDIVRLRPGQDSSASGLVPGGMYRVSDRQGTQSKVRVHIAMGTTDVDPSELWLCSFAGQSTT